jgi:arginine deiminase
MEHRTERSVVCLAAYGGEGWSPRGQSTKDELGTLWHPAHVESEWEPLHAVLLHRPGVEMDEIRDPNRWQMSQIPHADKLRAQHDALAQLYRQQGIEVFLVDPGEGAHNLPNLVFCRDLFAMTPEGAIVSRMASTVRAGEERTVARRLAMLGVPILLTVRSPGTFEGGAELLWVDRSTALLGCGIRTNEEGARQVADLLRSMAVEVVFAALPVGAMHLLGTLNLIGPDLALAWPGTTPYVAIRLLRERGFRILYLPDQTERETGMALNLVTLRPYQVLMPSGCPHTRALLESAGVTCLEIDVSELIKAEGAIGCSTGILWRQQ